MGRGGESGWWGCAGGRQLPLEKRRRGARGGGGRAAAPTARRPPSVRRAQGGYGAGRGGSRGRLRVVTGAGKLPADEAGGLLTYKKKDFRITRRAPSSIDLEIV